MTAGNGPEGPKHLDSTTTRDAARSLWEQPSFLVTFALCVLLLTVLAVGSESRPGARLGAIILLIPTIVGYALYRRRRGWKALPTSGWLPSRHASRRRWIGLGLYVALLLLFVVGAMMPPTTVSPGVPDAPWTKSLAATTCGDWQSVMTARQRLAFAQALLAYDLTQPHGAALNQATANDYISMIADTCKDESPSSLVVQ